MYLILVWYTNKRATGGGGGVVGEVTASAQNLDTICLANFAHFRVATILAISTYLKPNI
jgi:hypothetical protein